MVNYIVLHYKLELILFLILSLGFYLVISCCFFLLYIILFCLSFYPSKPVAADQEFQSGSSAHRRVVSSHK